MRRATIVSAAVAGVLLLTGATGFAASAFAASMSTGDAPAPSTVTRERVDMDSSDCPSVGAATDAMQALMDALHGDGSFDAMHGSTGDMMGN